MSDSRNRKPMAPGMDALMATAVQAPTVTGYRVDRLVGEGGFGQVWRATREEDGRLVAIKILHLELIRSNDALTRFERELRAIERLQHRNVVRALDEGTLDDGRPYLVLEYIEGPSLRDVIHERGSLPPSEMLAVLQPLCHALAEAHKLGLVHRDVKASNVILGHDTQGPRPVLLDFGLVKLLDAEGPGLTSSRSMLGTPAAMAPEQMKGQPVTARTDVYAVALLAYHMLTGAPAFGGTPGVVQSYLQVHGPRPRPSAKVDIDPAIDEPIIRALAPDPSQRYATPIELLDALKAVIQPTATPDGEQEVITLYVEGGPAELAQASSIATGAGMTIAMTAPDSIIAVAPRLDLTTVRARLEELASSAKVAVGSSRASICAGVVDGPALDVEGWAPYPLATGLWITPTLL
ncbi:MAG TPA: serine/threonine-protein kinase [Kofleriaceae bacterium]|nr:serine/threonine-protein kinase [Kofleriaceae bacterium]